MHLHLFLVGTGSGKTEWATDLAASNLEEESVHVAKPFWSILFALPVFAWTSFLVNLPDIHLLVVPRLGKNAIRKRWEMELFGGTYEDTWQNQAKLPLKPIEI